jgi:N-acetylmuramoyl-L-alanine amidase
LNPRTYLSGELMRAKYPTSWRLPPRGLIVALLALTQSLAATAPKPEATTATGQSPPRACVPAEYIVAIDPGHSSARPGATSARGRVEYEFNAALARAALAGLNDAGFRAGFVVNPDGADLALQQRTMIAARRGARLFLSLHHDSVQPQYLDTWIVAGIPHRFSDRFNGYSVFFSSENADPRGSERFARAIAKGMYDRGIRPSLHHNEPIPGEGRPLVDPRTGVYRFDRLVVLRAATMPAALLEAGIIVNRAEEILVSSDAYRRTVVASITGAVREMCQSGTRE